MNFCKSAVFAFVLVAGLAGCSGGDDDQPNPPVVQAPQAPVPAPVTAPATPTAPTAPAPVAMPAAKYEAGFRVLNIDDPNAAGAKAVVNLWYPTHDVAGTRLFGDWQMHVAPGAAPADGRYHLIVLSHGSGGTEFNHRDLAQALAEQGYVVAAPRHTGNNAFDNSGFLSGTYWFGRAKLVSATIDAVLADPKIGALVLPSGVGVAGHSVGAYTALTVAGAVPDLSLIGAHCMSTPADTFCAGGAPPQPGDPYSAAIALRPVPTLKDPRVAAFVAMAPIGAPFSAQALKAVSIPARVYGAEFDDPAPARYHAEVVAAGLPQPVEYVLVKNATHFAFLPPFPEEKRAQVGDAAVDRPGFDRAQFHVQLNAEIVDFFNRKLR